MAAQAGRGGLLVRYQYWEDELRRLGIDPSRALTEWHVQDEHQAIRSELDADLLLLQRVARLGPLAWLIGLAPIRSLLARLHHRSVRRGPQRDGRL